MIENRSEVAWASAGSLPVSLSHHLHRVRSTGAELAVFDNPRVALPEFAAPGARIKVDLPVEAPSDTVSDGPAWRALSG